MKHTDKKEPPEFFDFTSFEEEAIKKLMTGEHLPGENGVLTPLIERFLPFLTKKP